MSQVIRVGPCVGCGTVARLVGAHDDACIECMRRRGIRWLTLARRVHEDEAFAAAVYARLPERWRKQFQATFGFPRE
jgi:hypothetical protein